MSVSGPVRFATATGVFAAARVVVFLRASERIGTGALAGLAYVTLAAAAGAAGGCLRARVTR